MPTTIPVAAFIVGAVLIVIAILGGNFEAFTIKMSGSVGRNTRIIAGLVGAGFIVLGLWLSIFPSPFASSQLPPTSVAQTGATTSIAPATSTPTSTVPPIPVPPTRLPTAVPPTSLPLIQRRAQFRVEFTGLLTNYDLDGGRTFDDSQNPDVDFFFKPDNAANPQSLVGVVPMHGAKFAGGFLDVLPWEVPQDQFMTSSSPYSVPQNRQIPCVTSRGVYCSFTLIIANNGLTIPYVIYSR